MASCSGVSALSAPHPHVTGVRPNFIAGSWREGADALENVNPSDTRDIVGTYARASAHDVEDAVSAAKAAFPHWAQGPAGTRAEVLDAIGTEIIARKDELGDLLAREEGKTLPEAVAEALRAGQIFKYFSAESYRAEGATYRSLRPGVTLEVRREPLGVVGAITPWNFPLAIPAWKIAPALAFGNTVVFKPAGLVPGSAWALAEIIARAGLPAGAFNLLMGQGADVGAALAAHPDVAGVTFTGSTDVGRRMGAEIFARGGRMQLEMGGKNPLIVLDDADPDEATDLAIAGAFHSAGQRCTASSRLIVTGGIHDTFVEQMVEKMARLRVDDARKSGTDIGPVVSEPQRAIHLDYVHVGEREGAVRAIGGDILARATPGWYLSPALFTSARPDMRICREEIFGPIAAVIRAGTYEEALAVANDTDFGLSAGIVTKNRARIDHFLASVQAGMAQVNLPTAGMDFHAPFTGRKHSSFGPPEKGSECREFFTVAKVVHAAYGG
ncbi:MAG: aldehyde dehydrogenase family protein [bacterium]|nr:aldehyde dehydrogenase family protein [bacterium]